MWYWNYTALSYFLIKLSYTHFHECWILLLGLNISKDREKKKKHITIFPSGTPMISLSELLQREAHISRLKRLNLLWLLLSLNQPSTWLILQESQIKIPVGIFKANFMIRENKKVTFRSYRHGLQYIMTWHEQWYTFM